MTESKPAILTSLLSALLVDAAVETFLSGAPVRWWVVGTVAAYLTLAVGIWRFGGSLRDQFGWMASPGAPVLVLLGLLAVTAWMPEGLTRGVVLLRLPTSVVLSALSAVAVVLAGLVLVRLRVLPLWARTAAGLLAAYGVAAFVAAVLQGTPYARLFDGDSVWRPLPAWLQGSFVGGVFIVSAAIVAGAVRLIRQVVPPASRAPAARQVVALTLSLSMLWSGIASTGALGVLPAGSTIAAPSAGSPDDLARAFLTGGKGSLRAQSTDLPAVLARLEALGQQIDRREFDLDAMAASLPSSVDDVFAFVRDSIAYEAYEGVLRGAQGTLMARAGNSHDKSLLLATLLERKGFRVRFAMGRISADNAELLLAHMFDETRPFSALPSEEAMAGAAGISATEALQTVRSFGNDAWGAQFRELVVNAKHVVHSGGSGNNGGCDTNPPFLEVPPNEDPS